MTDSAHHLPSTRRLLTSLTNTIATTSTSNQKEPTQTPQPATETLSPPQKPALLTLHTLFPNDLLPALDLLDRNLVTRLVVQQSPDTPPDLESTSTTPATRTQTAFYLVRSTQQPHASSHSTSRSRYADPAPQAVYEVRPRAWNCSCPAFAFAAFPPAGPSGSYVGRAGESEDEGGEEDGWRFGGLTRGGRGDVPPVCKHLLACVLAEWAGFGMGMEVREVMAEEFAGWGGGWGD